MIINAINCTVQTQQRLDINLHKIHTSYKYTFSLFSVTQLVSLLFSPSLPHPTYISSVRMEVYRPVSYIDDSHSLPVQSK